MFEKDSSASQVDIMGIGFNNLTMEETIEKVEQLINAQKPSMIFTLNVHRTVSAIQNRSIKEIYDIADIILPDGVPLVWISRILGNPLKERIAGADLFPLFCETASRKGYKIFLLGAAPGIAEKTKEILEKRHSGIKVVGTFSPSFGFENDVDENRKIVSIIKKANPDVLFIALGHPKEEEWILKYRNEIKVPVSIGIGATFDFISGKLRRAPKWLQTIGLEWFFRICQEPRRLWKRYLIGNTYFIWLVFRKYLEKL